VKTISLGIGAAAFFSLLAITPNLIGQVPVENTTTTVTSTGTVSQFTPNAIVVRANASTVPVRYTFTKTTTYVDENGNPVSVETVRSGIPVTVYYEKSGDNLVADKVVVKKTVSTTTTTDATAPITSPSSSTPPSTDGVITDADSDAISIRTDSSASPVHYAAHNSTAYVDENGNPVARNSLKAGTPVTIFFERDGDNLRATRVVVKNPVIIEKTTTQETTVPPQ